MVIVSVSKQVIAHVSSFIYYKTQAEVYAVVSEGL